AAQAGRADRHRAVGLAAVAELPLVVEPPAPHAAVVEERAGVVAAERDLADDRVRAALDHRIRCAEAGRERHNQEYASEPASQHHLSRYHDRPAAERAVFRPAGYSSGVRFRDVVETSAAVGATRSRREKVGRLAELLRRLGPGEVGPAVSYLSGAVPQGKLGVGWATVSAVAGAAPAALADGALTVAEVDDALSAVAAASGAGSTGERRRLLAGLLGRAGASERDFLLRLLTGELRQGALEGIMAEAIAHAADLPPDRVRRALMLSGDLAAVAAA